MINTFTTELEAIQFLLDNGYCFNTISNSYVKYDIVNVHTDYNINIEIEAYPIVLTNETYIVYHVSSDKIKK